VSRVTSFSEWLLRQPLIWGGLACLAFYALVVQGSPEGSFLARYFAGHTVAYCTTALFFVGLAGLLIRLLGLVVQFASVDRTLLKSPPEDGNTVEEASVLLTELESQPATLQESYLVSRLREALSYVRRTGSADSLDGHLRYLEDADHMRMHQGYGMVRIVVSIIPILGFLGTVIGITLAIAQLNLSGSSMEDSLPAVISGLSVAFDTTALALTLSTILLFAKFCVERIDLRLLTSVDANVDRHLVGRFRQYGSTNDPHLASVRRMSEQLLGVVQSSAQHQSKVLLTTVEHMSQQWSEVVSQAGTKLDETFSGAVSRGLEKHATALNEGVVRHASDLDETLVRHAELLNEGLQHHTAAMTEAETKQAEENRVHLADVHAAVGQTMLLATSRQEKMIHQSENMLKEMQGSLVEAAGTTVAQQEQLIKQGDILLRVVEATGQVKKLEESLNQNLAALAGSHNFQQTVVGLSAALQLLGARLGQPLVEQDAITLQDKPSHSKAA